MNDKKPRLFIETTEDTKERFYRLKPSYSMTNPEYLELLLDVFEDEKIDTDVLEESILTELYGILSSIYRSSVGPESCTQVVADNRRKAKEGIEILQEQIEDD